MAVLKIDANQSLQFLFGKATAPGIPQSGKQIGEPVVMYATAPALGGRHSAEWQLVWLGEPSPDSRLGAPENSAQVFNSYVMVAHDKIPRRKIDAQFVSFND
jgi:hypothetical protein